LYNKIADIRKDFADKSSNDLTKKPRRRVGRGLVHQEYVEVREREPGKPGQDRRAEVSCFKAASLSFFLRVRTPHIDAWERI